MKTIFCFVFIVFFSFGSLFGQRSNQQNFFSLSEIGACVGKMYYLGDLNKHRQFYKPNLSFGLIYRYNINSRLASRFSFLYGKVQADDADSQDEYYINRNLSFFSDIFEFSGGLEFHYLPFQMGNRKYRGTTYMFIQGGVFRMNPKTNYNGEIVELQPLATEGQGTSLSSKKNRYSLMQICFPIGLGCKLSINKFINLNVEIGIRKTFTDYLDDVSSDTYVDQGSLAQINGQMSADLSNRSLDGSRFGNRGNSRTSDWYVFYGGMISFRLGKTNKCAMPR